MKTTVNEVSIIGRLYNADLKEDTVKNTESSMYGKEYINGTVNIATDDECLNVVPIKFVFVTSTTKKNTPNPTYMALKKILNGDGIKTVSDNGKDEASIISIAKTAIVLEDSYSVQTKEAKTWMVNSGGFVTIKGKNDLPKDEASRNFFDVDIIITGFRRVEENMETETPEYGIVHGAIFGYSGNIMPVDFKVKGPDGIGYFEGLGVSNANPIFTKIHGIVESNRIVTQKTESVAFGKPIITTSVKTTRDWVITSVIETPYEFGADNVITTEELTKKMQDREIHLAKVKADAEKYAESKNKASSGGPVAPAVGIKTGGFNF